MASNPPAECCTIGVKHEGSAQGEVKQFGGVEAYIANPADNPRKSAILILTDVIGHGFINAQLIADQFAANGYFVVMPDLFHGDPVPLNMPPGFDFPSWLQGHQALNVDPTVESVLKELRASGYEKIGAVGYCFGAKYVVRHLKPAKKEIDVGYVAHPSFVEATELAAIQGPLSISAAETDNIFPADKRHESEDILPKTEQPYQINLFSGVQHGFAVRGDITKPVIRFERLLRMRYRVRKPY